LVTPDFNGASLEREPPARFAAAVFAVIRSGDAESTREISRPAQHGGRGLSVALLGARRDLGCAQQDRTCRSLVPGDDVHAPMDPVASVDVEMTGRPEHNGTSRSGAPVRMRRRIVFSSVGLGLDDSSLHDVGTVAYHDHRADEITGHVVGIALEETSRVCLARHQLDSSRSRRHVRLSGHTPLSASELNSAIRRASRTLPRGSVATVRMGVQRTPTARPPRNANLLPCPMRIVSWNVNGIRAVQRKGMFDPFLDSLRPDIICLQETKAEQSQADCNLDGYEEYWHSATKKGYSGTAIFSKHAPTSVVYGLPANLVERFQFADDSFGNPNEEGRVVTAEFNDFFLVTAYTPNAKGDLSRLALRHQKWDPAFLSHVKSLNEKKPVAICGDLNVAHTNDDLANPKSNVGKAGFTSEERGGLDQLLDAGFVDSFRVFTQGNGHYTWWSNFSGARSKNVGWRIDYFLVSSDLAPRVQTAEIHPDIMGSDHCPVSITLKN